VRDCLRAEAPRHFGDLARLERALRADAERIDAAAQHVAHHEKAQGLVPVGLACVDEQVLRGAQALRTGFERAACRVVEPAGVDGHGDDLGSVAILEPGDAERGVEPSAEGENDRLGHELRLPCSS
jgi:hypothetical protein